MEREQFLKEYEEIENARGHGMFDFLDELGLSRKGKLNCGVMTYQMPDGSNSWFNVNGNID